MQKFKFVIVGLELCLAFTAGSLADVVREPTRKFGLGDLQQVAISPDGKWMATSGGGGAFLWDFQAGTLLHRLEGHQSTVLALGFSPSGTLLTGGGDSVIREWDLVSGTELRSFAGHIGRIIHLALAPDGQSFVSVGDNTARVWSLRTGELLHTFTVTGAGIAFARFAPEGNRLVTSDSSPTNNVRVWNLSTEQTIGTFGGSAFIQNFEFVDGERLVTAADTVVQVWNIESGQLIRPLPGLTSADVVVVRFLTATNNSTVTAGCLNGRVITWDASTAQILHDFTSEGLFDLAAIPATNQVLTAHFGDQLVRVKNSETGETLRTFAGHTTSTIQDIGFSPDGRYVVSGGNEVLTRLWDSANAHQVAAFAGQAAGTKTARFAPDGTHILTTYGSPLLSARLWNVASGRVEREFIGHTGGLSGAVFSADGRLLATCSVDGTARLWDATTGTQIRVFSVPGALLSAVAISPDGTTIAAGSSDGVVRLWSTADGSLLRSLESDAGQVVSVAFSAATGELLVGWSFGVLRTFDPKTGELRLGSLVPQGFLAAAVFSPDGRFILDAEGYPSFTARLWDARTGEELRVFAGQAGEVHSVAFNANGTSILTGSDIVRLWSISDIAARLETERTPSGLELRWSVGTLQHSTRLNGPWLDLADAVSPWLIPGDQSSEFFRVKTIPEQ
ncbi:MAG TPA: WD40 repeat domain-containing protein [Verrucomicrobiae bacterium]|jgi:WD40 repeat protein|nr:WD40 repeat domain-containing protein [Verrucomicrobiae bacterium]